MLWMHKHKRKSFPRSAVARKRRRHSAIELPIITSHHHFSLITDTTSTLRPYTYTPPPLRETPTNSRSFYHPPTPSRLHLPPTTELLE